LYTKGEPFVEERTLRIVLLSYEYLEPWLPVLLEAVLAIYRPAFCRLEGYFTLIFAVGARCLVHFPGAIEISPATKSTVSHCKFSVRAYCSAHDTCIHSIYRYVFYIF